MAYAGFRMGCRTPGRRQGQGLMRMLTFAVALASVRSTLAAKVCGTEPWLVPTGTTNYLEIDNPNLAATKKYFGYHVTARNGYLLVYEGDAIRWDSTSSTTDSKKLHIYRLVANVWTHSQTWAKRPMLTKYGDRAKLSETAQWLATQDLGTYNSDSPPSACGSACDGTLELYKRTGTMFNTTANQILTHPLSYSNRAFGFRYTFLGDTDLFVIARFVGSAGQDSVFYFKLVGDTWTYQHEIQAPCGGGGFTAPLTLAAYNHPTDNDQDVVVLGHRECQTSQKGGVSVMFRNHGGADQFNVRQVILSTVAWSNFGHTLNIGMDASNNILLAGANKLDDSGGLSQGGAALFFRFDHASFLANNDPFPAYAASLKRIAAYQEVQGRLGNFESSVAIGSDIVAYGIQKESYTISEGGAVVIFCKDQGGIDNWGYAGHVMANNNVDDGQSRHMGLSLTYHEATHQIIAGAPNKPPNNEGAIAIFNSHSQPFGAAGPWTCILCEKGQYIYQESSPSPHVSCATCTEGYQDEYGRSTTCKLDCPPGSSISADRKSCTVCPAGTYSPGYTQVGCIPCAAGTYNDEVGQAECKSCAAGYAQPGTGSLECAECPPGLYAPAGSSSCLACGYDTYNDDRAAGECKACPLGGITVAAAQTAVTDCICPAEWAGDPAAGLKCVACELEKVACPFPTVYMTALAGYYTSTSRPNVALECVPSAACEGGAHEACAQGYEGTSCSSCSKGYFRSLTGCDVCPANSMLLTAMKLTGMFLLVVVVLTVLVIAVFLCQGLQRKIGFDFRRYMFRIMAALSIIGSLITYIQTVSTVLSLNIELPSVYSASLSYLSVLNLDITLVAQPECDVGKNFLGKYIVKLIGVLVFIIGFSLFRAVAAVFPLLAVSIKRMLMLRRDPESNYIPEPVTMHNIILGIGVNFCRAILGTVKVAYLPVHTMVLEPLRCVPVTSDDTGSSEYVMVVEPSIVCYTGDSDWTNLIPPCVIFFLIFSCGGQLVINVINLGFHRQNYRDHDIGELFNVLWIPYESQFYFWESVVVLRKFVFGLVTVTSLSAFNQLTLFLAVIVTFASFTVMARPYKELFDDLVEGSTLITLIILLVQVTLVQTETQSSFSEAMMGSMVALTNMVMMMVLLGTLVFLIWPREVFTAVKAANKVLLGDDEEAMAADNPFSDDRHKYKLDILKSTKAQRVALIRDEMYGKTIQEIIDALEKAGDEVETEITERSAGKADHVLLQQYRNYVVEEIERHQANLDRDIEKTQDQLLQVSAVLKDPLLGGDPMEQPPSLGEPLPETSPFEDESVVEEGKVKESPRIHQDSPRKHEEEPHDRLGLLSGDGGDTNSNPRDSPLSTPRETPRSKGKAEEDSPPDRPFKPRKVKYDPDDPEYGDFEAPKTIKFRGADDKSSHSGQTKGGVSGVQTKYGERRTMGAQIMQGHLAKMKNKM